MSHDLENSGNPKFTEGKLFTQRRGWFWKVTFVFSLTSILNYNPRESSKLSRDGKDHTQTLDACSRNSQRSYPMNRVGWPETE